MKKSNRLRLECRYRESVHIHLLLSMIHKGVDEEDALVEVLIALDLERDRLLGLATDLINRIPQPVILCRDSIP